MAYMTQEMKKEIAKLLKDVVPKGWKYSLGVQNLSTIVMNISSAPVDLIEEIDTSSLEADDGNRFQTINTLCIDRICDDKEVADTLKTIVKVLNHNNHDNSDAMTDYFDVGHYVTLNVGTWKKGFQVK